MNIEARVAPTPFDRFLSAQNEVIRSAAIRALPKLMDVPDQARERLLEHLLDEDPDVRCDAMEALVTLAEPGDAAAIRQSLTGDPVREVKVFAIAALARLRDAEAVPVLRALAKSRAEKLVTWEDDTGDWDEWLDVQIAAIDALGALGAVEAVDDLIDALFDEFGQTVDDHVFAAFEKLGDHGAGVLLETFRQTSGVTRRRAAAALGKVAPDDLAAYLDDLLTSDIVELRRIGLRNLSSDHQRCRDLAFSDPDPSLRLEALAKLLPGRPDLAIEALADTDQRVKATALRHLQPPFEPEFEATLVENMMLWLDTADTALGQAICELLVRISPDRACDAVLGVLADREKPLELRVSTAKLLGAPELNCSLDQIAEHLQNPAQQVRAAVLTVLRDRVEDDGAAMALAMSAIKGSLDVQDTDPSDDATYSDVGIPKEGAGPRSIEITPDGEIVERSDPSAASANGSTLASLLGQQAASEAPKLAEDTPEESGAKRAKRRPVEGSGDLAHSLACDALRVFADVPGDDLTDAIETRLSDSDATLRRAAWRALENRPASKSVLAAATEAAGDDMPEIRHSALMIGINSGDASAVDLALNDPDPLIRAEAVKRLPSDTALERIQDGAPVVRKAAAQNVIAQADPDLGAKALESAISCEASDVVSVLSADAGNLSEVRSILSRPDLSERSALVILRALDG